MNVLRNHLDTKIDKTLTYASETWTLQRENGKESSHSAHANGMNE